MKQRFLLLFLTFAAIGLALFLGCSKSDDNKVLAEVGDYKISLKEFNDIYQNVRQNFTSAQEEFDSKRDVLDTIIVNRLLAQAAYEMGIDQLEEISRLVLANRDKFLLDVLYQREIVDKCDVSDAEVKDFYDKQAYKYRASHILVKDLDTAQILLDSILKDGANFEQIAYEHSIDPGAKRNRGDLGYFLWGTMVPNFQDAVLNMEPGEISKPIQTKYGWHIIKLVDKQPNEARGDFEANKDKLRQQLLNYKISKRTEEYFDEIKAKYKIKVEKATCDYIMHKRESMYPPQILDHLPKNDFDVEQLDRSERELPLATWEGGQLTLFEYLTLAKQIPANAKPDLDDVDSLESIIFRMKTSDILTYEANKMGLDKDPEYMRKIKLFKDWNMASIMRTDSIQAPDPPTEDEMRQYYDDNSYDFVTTGEIHLYEILLSDELLARKLAKEIKSLRAFKEKAVELTERSGKRESNGDLGYIKREWFPEIYDLARKTPDGTIGGPVVSGGKYSIFWVVDKKLEEKQDYLDVKERIRNILNQDRQVQAVRDFIDRRKADTDIKVFDDAIWSTIDTDKYASVDSATASNQ